MIIHITRLVNHKRDRWLIKKIKINVKMFEKKGHQLFLIKLKMTKHFDSFLFTVTKVDDYFLFFESLSQKKFDWG